MAKRKTAVADPLAETPPSETNGSLPEEPPTRAADPPQDATTPPSEPPSDTNGSVSDRKPVKVFSYMVARDTYVLASIWDRVVTLADGATFTAHDVSVRKRYRDQQSGEWKSLYSFRGSEIYAVLHALAQASAWILEARVTANGCPFS
jgi:hypothetical protein